MSDKPFRIFDEDDEKEFNEQVAAEPDLWRIYAEALPCKVKIENETFPRPHEVYNCTSCRRGVELPLQSDKEKYTCRCKWDVKLHIGPRWNDTGCQWWDRKIKIPRHGYMPGWESDK